MGRKVEAWAGGNVEGGARRRREEPVHEPVLEQERDLTGPARRQASVPVSRVASPQPQPRASPGRHTSRWRGRGSEDVYVLESDVVSCCLCREECALHSFSFWAGFCFAVR